jgi:5-methylcytosine-specific restriction endonuclease McrA
MTTMTSLAHLTDMDLIGEVKALAESERQATAVLIASLAELDSRRLYLREGCSSLFTYCTHVLHLSEHAAYGRIQAARTARRFPRVLDLLAAGDINLTTIGLLAAHLTADNQQELLTSAAHKTKREVERLVASLAPRPDVASTVRKLPVRATPSAVTEPAPPVVRSLGDAPQAVDAGMKISISPPPAKSPVVCPLAPERYKVQFTISRETHAKLRRAQDLMRHTNSNGDPAVVFDRALTLLLAELERQKLAATDRPRATRSTQPGSRHIPSSVKREVWARDGGQCAFRGEHRRCDETRFLEYHHVVPYADGGEAIATNIELRCRPHNAYESEQLFGPWTPMFVKELGPDPLNRVHDLTGRQHVSEHVEADCSDRRRLTFPVSR